MTTERTQQLRAARERKMAEWFDGRRWRVCTELSFETDGVVVKNGSYRVRGSSGCILQEVDPETGADVERSRASFPWLQIRHAVDRFPGCVAEVPQCVHVQRAESPGWVFGS